MNKSKAKRLRKELERESRVTDRVYQATRTKLSKPRVLPSTVLADLLAQKPLSDVQKAVHFEEP